MYLFSFVAWYSDEAVDIKKQTVLIHCYQVSWDQHRPSIAGQKTIVLSVFFITLVELKVSIAESFNPKMHVTVPALVGQDVWNTRHTIPNC